jgi:diguanylate cyclase (GGDEF)-like protein
MNSTRGGKRSVEVLIVEDSATQREQLQHLLQAHGFAVASAANGRQALESARRRKPTVIITDIVMPELDGYGLCKAIRADESLKEIPVILLTSLSDAHDVIFGLECGADNFIRKPYQADYLLQRVDHLLMNLELRRNQKMRMGIEINLGGQRHFITAERQQILDLLISTYEQATHINRELAAREGELAHSNEVLNGLYRIAEGLNGATSERQVTEAALERALVLPGIRAGWISLREGESGFRLAAARNLPPALEAPGAMEGDCLCRRRLLSGELDSAANILACERLERTTGDTQGLRYHAAIPLWLCDRTLGVMNLVGPREGLFSEDELKILYGVGNQVAVALERAHLHEHMERLVAQRTAALSAEVEERTRAEARVTRLNRVYAVLSGINTTIVRTRDRQEVFEEACRIAVEHGGFLMAWIGLLDANGLDITPAARAGRDDGYLDGVRLTVREGVPDNCRLLVEALRKDAPVVCNEVETDARMARWREAALRNGFRSLVVFPLHHGEKIVGVLVLYAPEPHFFDTEEMKLLTEVAGDISFALDHIAKTERINHLAYYDAVTGLANRTLFQERLAERARTAERERDGFAVCIFDVERFKNINDTMGRQAGDALLRQIAERMGDIAGDRGRLARVSGDGFALILPEVHTGDDAARQLDHDLRACFEAPFTVDGSELKVSAKAGLALFPNDATEGEALFAYAEAAWKKAKETGERYLFYTQTMSEAVAQNFSLENKLRVALERGEFVLHYQPQVDLETRRIAGTEALIRWQNPEAGLVPPMEFIPLMEETGLILEVGTWALKQAVLDHREWVSRGLAAPRIAVNISAIQLRQRDFVDVVTSAVGREAGPSVIDLELTESELMKDIQGNIEKLNALRALGMKVAIDDFGTGHSSLAYLARLPVDVLKIDRSFIIKMLDDPGAMVLVQTIISLANALKLTVIAEGVDSEEQARMLRLLRCDQAQGFLVSKPLPMDEMAGLLDAG